MILRQLYLFGDLKHLISTISQLYLFGGTIWYSVSYAFHHLLHIPHRGGPTAISNLQKEGSWFPYFSLAFCHLCLLQTQSYPLCNLQQYAYQCSETVVQEERNILVWTSGHWKTRSDQLCFWQDQGHSLGSAGKQKLEIQLQPFIEFQQKCIWTIVSMLVKLST